MRGLDRQLGDAGAQGDMEAIAALIAAGADPNVGNAAGNTALHYPAHADCADAVRTLLSPGAASGVKQASMR